MTESIPHFRTRNDRKRDHMQGEVSLIGNVTIFYDGTDTEARVTFKDATGEFYGEGISLLRSGDHYDKELGEQLAITRATIEALEDHEAALIAQSISEAKYLANRAREERRATRQEAEYQRLSDKLMEAFDAWRCQDDNDSPHEDDEDAQDECPLCCGGGCDFEEDDDEPVITPNPDRGPNEERVYDSAFDHERVKRAGVLFTAANLGPGDIAVVKFDGDRVVSIERAA